MCPFKDPDKRREYNRRYQKEYYQKNKNQMRKSVKHRKQSIRDWVVELKRGLNCSQCGISGKDNPWMIEFHHNDDYEKTDVISFLVSNGYGKKRILKEINKCFPVCANCHRQIHYTEAKKIGRRGANLKKGEGNMSASAKAKRKKNKRYRKKRLE